MSFGLKSKLNEFCAFPDLFELVLMVDLAVDILDLFIFCSSRSFFYCFSSSSVSFSPDFSTKKMKKIAFHLLTFKGGVKDAGNFLVRVERILLLHLLE